MDGIQERNVKKSDISFTRHECVPKSSVYYRKERSGAEVLG